MGGRALRRRLAHLHDPAAEDGSAPNGESAVTVTADDGVAIAVHDFGGRGPPLLLAHANGFHGLVWRPLVPRLRDTFRCVAYDHRAHGDSGPPADGDLAWERLAADVLAVVDGMGLQRPFGLGHSSGGGALVLAEEARPGTFAGLYCYEPVLVPADPPLGRDPDNWLAAMSRRRREVFASRDEARRRYATSRLLGSLCPAALDAYVAHGFADLPDGRVRLKCRPAHEALIYEMATAHHGYARLGAVRCPVTLACGADTDAYGPAEIAPQAARLADGYIEVHEGLSHMGPLQAPERIAAAVRRAFAAGRD